MKRIISYFLVLTLMVALSACSGQKSNDSKKDEAQFSAEVLDKNLDKVRVFESDGFSIRPPMGWKEQEVEALNGIPAFIDSSQQKFAPNIVFSIDQYTGSLDEYLEISISVIEKENADKNLKILSQEEVTTNKGLSGMKLVMKTHQYGLDLQQTFYIFEMDETNKFIITCSDLADRSEITNDLFEMSVSTFEFIK